MNTRTAEFYEALRADLLMRGKIMEDILAEVERQLTMRCDGTLPFTCSEPMISAGRKLAVLMEEVGEVATELQAEEPDRERLYNELIQVAAVAAAWAECLDPLARGAGPGRKLTVSCDDSDQDRPRAVP